MSVRRCLACVLALTALGAAVAGQPRPDPAAEAERLVKLFGSPRFAERESALKALEALGPAAVPALRRAALGRDPEVLRRVGELIAKHERQADADAAFAPTKVRLRASGTPLGDVVSDLVRQAHVQIHLAREPVDLAERPVTLQTGETSFWEALDALCRAAKVSVQPGQYYPGMPENSQVIPTSVLRGLSGGECDLVLHDGAPSAYPTAFLGAVRVRLLPERWDNRGRGPGDERRWMFEVFSEPLVHWQGQPAFQFDPPPGLTANRSPHVPDNISRYRVPNTMSVRIPLSTTYLLGRSDTAVHKARRHEFPVYVQSPAAAAPTIPELKGTLVSTVQISSQLIAALDDVTQPDAAAVSPGGYAVRVRDCRRDADGSVALKVEVEKLDFAKSSGVGRNILSSAITSGQPPNTLPAANALVVLNFLMEDHGCGLRLFDENDRPYQLTAPRNGVAIEQRGTSMVVTLTVDARQADQPGQPRRLELIGPRMAPIEAKFTLRDVPRP